MAALTACMVFINVNLWANVKPAKIFSDNMVLQRGINAPVWGWADPDEKITVTINGNSISTVAGPDGKWKIVLPVFKAGGPYELTIKGKNEVKFKNILFGDVWIASGQSNMEWPLVRAKNGEEEVQNANYPEIRLFYVPKRVGYEPKEDLDDGVWEVCTPETAQNFSAVAYFFGRDLHKDLNVPIGLINCNWGGTPAEAWTSAEMLKALPDFKDRVIELENGSNWEDDLETNAQRAREKREIMKNSFKGLELGVQKVGYSSVDWPVVIAPNWEEKLGGVVWLRKVLDIPKEYKGQELKMDLGRLSNNATVYFNGVELGSVWSPYFAEFTIPPKVVKAGRNVITVRLYHAWASPNFLGPEDRMKLYAPGGAVLENLAGPWKYKSGIEPEFPETVGYHHYPASLFNGMLYALIPYGMKGVIWYQGESNAGRACQYRSLFQAMIEDWRVRWDLDYFPFLFVQLANYMDIPEEPVEDDWAELREAQLMALRLPNTGMAVTIDIGEMFDIHPRNKQDVGHRLALAAKKIAYGQDIVYSGPIYKSMEVKNGEARISFDHVGKGLMKKGEKLTGFQIAGKDRKFHWAHAQIVGGKVYVSSDKVKEPVAVRYGWAHNPECNLYNKNGLPASPFRTDDWPGITVGNK